jgi:hypothetical protein
MLIQKIEKYKQSFAGYQGTPAVQFPGHTITDRNKPYFVGPLLVSQNMGKHGYNQLVNSLPFKKGDFVVSTHQKEPPYHTYGIFQVVDIIEMQALVKNWGDERTGPFLLYLASFNSTGAFNAGISQYKVINEADVPDNWSTRYAYTNDSTP